MNQKRGLKINKISENILNYKNKIIITALIFFVFSLTNVFAGDITIKEGFMNISEGSLEVNKNLTINGASLSVDSGANRVGIGIRNPVTTFQVKGANNVTIGMDAVGSSARITAINDLGSANVPLKYQASFHNFTIGATERMIINGSGFVGIGTSNPAEILDVNGTIRGKYLKLFASGAEGGEIQISNKTGDAEWYIDDINDTSANGLRFRQASPALDFIFFQRDSGRVGIGTSTPTVELDVAGVLKTRAIQVFISGAEGGEIQISNRTGDAEWFIDDINDTSANGLRFRQASPALNFIFLQRDSGRVGIGTSTPSFPLTVMSNISDGSNPVSIWASSNVSATGYITRTTVFDKSKLTSDYIKDASYYLDKGEINHSKFYGYTTYENIDYGRPVEIEDNITIYPYTKIEEGVELGMEIDVLRQAIYELKEENKLMKQSLCKLGEVQFC